MAAQADQFDAPRLLTGHFTVSGAVVGSERSIMLGRDIAVLLSSVADPRWDYVALGHVHKHQNLTHGRQAVPPVVYSGSMERIDFGEEGDPKGFCWVELGRQDTNWQFVQLENARPFVTLNADLRQSTNPTETVLKLIKKHRLTGAVVRLIVDLLPETEITFNEVVIKEELRRAGVYQMASVRKQIEQPTRARLGGNPEGLTATELLDRYLLSKEIGADRRADLLDAAQVIFEKLQAGE